MRRLDIGRFDHNDVEAARLAIEAMQTPLRSLDAIHLVYAQRRNLTLVTLDGGLAGAAESQGYSVIMPTR